MACLPINKEPAVSDARGLADRRTALAALGTFVFSKAMPASSPSSVHTPLPISAATAAGSAAAATLTSTSAVADPRTAAPAPAATHAFSVSDGRIHDPQGHVYYAHGVNVANWAATGNGAVNDAANGTANGKFLLQLLPKCNMVRLNCQLDEVGKFDSFVRNLTSAKCVVVFEYHRTDNRVPTSLANTLAWYRSNADHYKSSPYVWFGTINEPGNLPSPRIARMNKAIYDAVRATGNKAPIMISIDAPYQNLAPYAAYYKDMTNVVWDLHYYGYALKRDTGSYLTDQKLVDDNLEKNIQLVQTGIGIRSSDGVMPLIIGEYGTSTTGDQPDVNGVQVVDAVHFARCSGAAAWAWSAGAGDRIQDKGVLKAFGQAVKLWMAGSPPRAWADPDNS